ncbi:MAG: helix-turn-helix domain-containing protein [Chloroflexota bacterium]
MESKKRPQSGEEPRTAADLAPELSRQVRSLRRAKGWTLDQLSGMSAVSRSMLSQVERGEANPTLGVAFRIARAFGVSLDDLVTVPPYARTIEVIRADEETYHFRNDPGCRVRTLSPLYLEKDAEFYEVCLAPGRSLSSAAHVAGTREILTVGQGLVRVSSGADAAELGVGDSAYYPADVAHSIDSIGQVDARLFLIDLYRD